MANEPVLALIDDCTEVLLVGHEYLIEIRPTSAPFHQVARGGFVGAGPNGDKLVFDVKRPEQSERQRHSIGVDVEKVIRLVETDRDESMRHPPRRI